MRAYARVQTTTVWGPEDPWLHLEWGATLLSSARLALRDASLDRLQQAARHLNVSALLFSHAAQKMLAAQGAEAVEGQHIGDLPVRQTAPEAAAKLTALDGRPLSAVAALQAASQALEVFSNRTAVVAHGVADSKALWCAMTRNLCMLQLRWGDVLQEQCTGAHSNSPGDQSGTQNGRDCLQRLSEHKGCEAHTAELLKLVGQ